MVNAKHMGVAVAALDQAAVVAMAMGSTWTGGIGGMQGGMRREQVLVVLVGVANTTVAGSRCSAVARSRGRSMGAWWAKMGLWAGLAVPDVVGVVNVVPSGFDLTCEGGGLVGTACGRDWLTPGIASLVAGGRASWGASRVARGSTMLRVVRVSPRASPSLSYLGTLLVWLASAILCSTRLPPSSTLCLGSFLTSDIP